MNRVRELASQQVRDVESLQGSQPNPNENLQTLWAQDLWLTLHAVQRVRPSRRATSLHPVELGRILRPRAVPFPRFLFILLPVLPSGTKNDKRNLSESPKRLPQELLATSCRGLDFPLNSPVVRTVSPYLDF
jgi:hypothetical protein